MKQAPGSVLGILDSIPGQYTRQYTEAVCGGRAVYKGSVQGQCTRYYITCVLSSLADMSQVRSIER